MTFLKNAALIVGLTLPLPSVLAAQQAAIVCQPLADGTPTMRVSEVHGVNIAGVNPGSAVGAFGNQIGNTRNYGEAGQNRYLLDSFGFSPLLVPAFAGPTVSARMTVVTGQTRTSNDRIDVGVHSGTAFTIPQEQTIVTGVSATHVLNISTAVVNSAQGRGVDSVRNSLILDLAVHDDTEVTRAELEYCVTAPRVDIDVLQCCMGISEFEPSSGPTTGYSVPRFYEDMPVTISVDSQFSQGFYLSLDLVDEANFDFTTGFPVIQTVYSDWVHLTSNRPANAALPTGFVVQNYTPALTPGLYQIGVATGPAWVIDHTLFYVE